MLLAVNTHWAWVHAEHKVERMCVCSCTEKIPWSHHHICAACEL